MLRPSTYPSSRRVLATASNAARPSEADSSDKKPTFLSDAACCARAATGHAAAPPMSVMNSRRFMAARSFDHLVGAGEHDRRDFQAKRLRGLEVDYQLELGWILHREIGRLLALEDAIDVTSGAAVLVHEIGAV